MFVVGQVGTAEALSGPKLGLCGGVVVARSGQQVEQGAGKMIPSAGYVLDIVFIRWDSGTQVAFLESGYRASGHMPRGKGAGARETGLCRAGYRPGRYTYWFEKQQEFP